MTLLICLRFEVKCIKPLFSPSSDQDCDEPLVLGQIRTNSSKNHSAEKRVHNSNSDSTSPANEIIKPTVIPSGNKDQPSLWIQIGCCVHLPGKNLSSQRRSSASFESPCDVFFDPSFCRTKASHTNPNH